MSRKNALAAAITVMLYTRPAIISGERVPGLEVLTRDHTDGPYARAIFAEDEALERLESGFWVDHPVKLSTLDKAIAEAAEKEAAADKKAQDEQDAKDEKKKQDGEVAQKAPESTATDSEQKDAPKATEGEKDPESGAEAAESTQSEGVNADKPKDGEKVDGAKVQIKKKVK